MIRGRDVGVGCHRSRAGVRVREARRHLVQRRDSPSPETPVDRASIRSLQPGQVRRDSPSPETPVDRASIRSLQPGQVRRDSPSPETPVDRASIRSLQPGQVPHKAAGNGSA